MENSLKIIQRKKRKSYNIAGHAHELTFSCYHQYDYLKNPLCCRLFMEELSKARGKYAFYLWAYVLMTTHVHLLLYPYKNNYNISFILQSIKGKMSTRYRNLLNQKNPELFRKMCIKIGRKKTFRFWQVGGGFDRNLWSPKAVHSSINYIEANPVRAALVENPEDWKWSSARARKYQKGLIPDNLGIPILMK
ncbi:MAG: transposase [Syntrophaceae bacterium]|nr:transposase [Syntrophaceae bacterium]